MSDSQFTRGTKRALDVGLADRTAADEIEAAIFAAHGGGGGGGGAGTVTQVAITVPAGLNVAGSPITGTGTFRITTALVGLLKGTGSGFAQAAAGTDYYAPGAAIAAADLPLFGPSGPDHARGAVPDPGSSAGVARFLREDRTWAVIAGGAGGTVTSVAVAVPAGLAVAGSPVSGAGTITISTLLSGVVKGTGSGFAQAVIGTDYYAPGHAIAAADLPVFVAGARGAVPSPGGAPDGTRFLADDGTFKVPPSAPGLGGFSTPGVEDVRDHLAPPYGGQGNAAATRAAIHAAIAAAAAAGKPTVWLEPGIDWYVDRAVFLDSPYIALRGAGSKLSSVAGTDLTVVVGIPRAGLTSGHYILNPHNDGSAHTRYSLALSGDSHVAQRRGGASGGADRWVQRHLACDVAFDNAAGGLTATECLFGWGSGSPSPLAAWSRPGGIMVRFRCNDGELYEFSLPAATLGYHEYSFEVGADTATLLAFVDGLRVVPVALSSNLAAWTPADGRRFVANDGTPFTIGSLSTIESNVIDFFGDPCHAVVSGLRLGVAPLYDATVPPGGAQAFLPGASSDPTLNQNNKFFQFVAGTRVVLALGDDPATVLADRLVEILAKEPDGSNNGGYGFYLANGSVAPTNYVAVEGIDLAVNGPYGAPLTVGLALHSRIGGTPARRQLFSGGAHSINQYAFDSEYVLDVSHCEFNSTRSNVRLWEAIAYFDNLFCHAGDLGCLEFDGFCSVVIGKVFAAIDQACATVIRGEGQLAIDYLNVDAEGPPSPTVAVIDWTAPTGAPQKGSLRWGHIDCSTLDSAAVVIALHNQADGSGSLSELVDGTVDVLGGPYPAVIRCDGPSWRHRRDLVSSGVGVPTGTTYYVWTGPGSSPM